MNTPPPIPPAPLIPPVIGPIAAITYELTRGDVFTHTLTLVFRNRLIQMMLLGFVLFNGWITLVPKWGKASLSELSFDAVVLALITMLMVFVIQLLTGLLVAFGLKQQGVVGEHTLAVTDEGLVERTAFNETLHKWPAVSRIVSQFGYIYIYIGDNNSHTVPRRCFSAEELKVFMTQLRGRATHLKS